MNLYLRRTALGLLACGTSALLLSGCGSSAPKDAANPPAVEQPARDATGQLQATGTETLDIVATPVVPTLPPPSDTPVGTGPEPTPAVPPGDIPTTPPLVITDIPTSAVASIRTAPAETEKSAAVITRTGADQIRTTLRDLDLINDVKLPADKAAVMLDQAGQLRGRIEADTSQDDSPKSVVLDNLDEFTHYVELATQARTAQEYSGLMRKAQISLTGVEDAAKQ